MKYLKTVLVLVVLISSFLPQKLFAQDNAIFLLSPASATYNEGDRFSVELQLNSPEAVTSVKSYLEFDSSKIKVESIDTAAGIFPYWWENSFDNETGKIQLQASLPSPGAKEGLIARINFQAVQGGQTPVTFDASSLALKPSDENILNLTASVGAQFSLVSPPLITTIKSNMLVSTLVGILILLIIYFVIVRKKRLIKGA
jgi:hypothetical protein